MIGITILGSTGSIGINTLDVVSKHLDRFQVIALTAHQNVEKLYEQCVCYRPRYAVMSDAEAALKLQTRLKTICSETEVLAGVAGLEFVASLAETDYVMAAIVGAVGLLPTLAAVRAGKRILLANKESLVMMGALFMEEVHRHQATLLPIDSEHNAIFQCLPASFKAGVTPSYVEKILLTASGGPFYNMPFEQLAHVTPEQACAHPTWKMGRKISTDSATMMNKGLEVIEAHYLFGLPAHKIEVLLHPQSIVHSLVEYTDGAVLAQLGSHDMRIPIANALAWPARIKSGVQGLDLATLGRLDFAPIDLKRYPCLALAYEALAVGGTATTILNAANEMAVQAFFDEQLAFTDIATVVAKVLDHMPGRTASTLEIILEDDAKARRIAQDLVHKNASVDHISSANHQPLGLQHV